MSEVYKARALFTKGGEYTETTHTAPDGTYEILPPLAQEERVFPTAQQLAREIRRLSDENKRLCERLTEVEKWRGDAEEACPDIARVRRMRLRRESVQ